MLKGRTARKTVAATLLLIFAVNTFAPTAAYALTSGPTAPEASSFEPVDTTDMVNLLTGDMTYNVPLLEVPGPEGGYPLSLSYHAGIQPNEDASWVGLGWSLNPGAITRNVNGYPDDWDDVNQVTRSYWSGGTTTTISIGINIGMGGAIGPGFGLSFSSDTYQGFGIGAGFNMGASFGGGIGVSASFGVSPFGDPYFSAGPTFASDAGISGRLSFETNFSSVSFGGGIGISSGRTSVLDASMSSSGTKPSLSIGGMSAYANNSRAGIIQTSSTGFGIGIPIPGTMLSIGLSFSKTRYWSDETVNVKTNGALHNELPDTYWDTNCSCWDRGYRNTAFDAYYLLEMDEPGVNLYRKIDPRRKLGGTFPDVDIYNVTAQGMSGNFKPYSFKSELFTQDIYVGGSQKFGEGRAQFPSAMAFVNPKVNFRFVNDFSNRYIQQSADFTFDNGSALAQTLFQPDVSPVYGDNDGNYGYNPATNKLAASKSIQYFTNSEIAAGTARSQGFIDCSANGFSRSAVSTYGFAPNQIGGFSITNETGVTYHYALPVYNKKETTRTERISQAGGYTFNTYDKNTPYAYTWYLTSITGPDYVDRDVSGSGYGKANVGDWGYWVNFNYGMWTDNYVWRNPAKGMTKDVDNEFKTASSGIKELYYLNSIQTRTHTAVFEKDIRGDGLGYPASDVLATENESTSIPWGISNGSKAPMKLQRVYLLRDADASLGNPAATSQYASHYGQNVIDKNDLNPVRTALTNAAVRIIEFNQDYALSPYTDNSDAPINNGSGKLSLNSVAFRGKGGVAKIPPLRFYYELDANEKISGNISISTVDNVKNEIGFTTGSALLPGDIFSFSQSGKTFYATYLRNQSGLLYARLINIQVIPVLPSTGTYSFVTTKNPGYYRDAYDMWGLFKSDFDKNALTPNENLGRTTTPTSSKGVDVWSLRKIKSSLCSDIKIEYESDSFNKSVMNSNGSFTLSNFTSSRSVSGLITMTFTIDTRGYAIGDFFATNDIVQLAVVQGEKDAPNSPSESINFYKFGSPDDPLEWYSYNQSEIQSVQNATQPITISSFNESAKTVTVTSDIPFEIANKYYSYKGGNLFLANKKEMYGGGIRVKSLSIVNTTDNSISKTKYNYNIPDLTTTSGVTSYLPNRFEFMDIPDGLKVNYASLLYMDDNRLLSLSRELPAPGIMYEYVSVSSERTNDGQIARELEGKTTYQFEVFNKNMVYVDPTFPMNIGTYPAGTPVPSYVKRQVTQQVGSLTYYKYLRNMTMRIFTAGIGNIKRVITYDKYNKKLTETISHYLHDDLLKINTEIRFYEQYGLRLNQYKKQGMIQERFFNSRYDWYDGIIGKELAIMNKREEYPVIMTGQTSIDYKTGTRSTTNNLEFDFYSGAVTKKIESDGYGNKFLTEIVPAYRKYSALGLKDNDINNKNMLTQQTATYSYRVDGSNNKLGLLSAQTQLWSNGSSVIKPDYSVVNQNTSGFYNGSGNVWRKSISYSWMADGTTVDNFTPIASFSDFNWSNPTASNPSWKKTGEITLYDVYSNILEAQDINSNYATTKMGYNNSKVVISGGPAKYAELAYSGAEDVPVSGVFNGDMVLQAATVSNDASNVHTGVKSVFLAGGQNGFSYYIPINKLQTGRDYIATVWMKGAGFNPAAAGLYFAVNDVVIGYGSVAGAAGSWHLATIKIPGSALAGGGNLRVGCFNNNGGINVYFDDLKFQPVNAGAIAYVYDQLTGELTHILDNNNLYTKFEYDGQGRLVKTYKETFASGVFKVSEFDYNYCQPVGLFTSAAITNQPFYRDNCPAGQQPNPYNVTVPAAQFSSGISQLDADQQAQQYALSQANANGTCVCAPSFNWAGGINPVSSYISLSGTRVNFTLAINYSGGSSAFMLGNLSAACSWPTSSRIVSILTGSPAGQSRFEVTISSTGGIQVNLISGATPTTGATVYFSGWFDLLANTQYNTPKSGTFSKACTPPATGSSVTYTVPAYTYSSLVGQTPDADQQALNDVAANGQNYANTNGTCNTTCSFTPASGTLTFYSNPVSSDGTTTNFQFVFKSSAASYNGGTIGTIGVGCRPTGTRTKSITEPSGIRTWSVTISSTGSVSVTRTSGPAATPQGNPIVIIGNFLQ